MSPHKTTDENGTITYRQEGMVHNDWNPAIIRADGSMEYVVHGHRSNSMGPAVINADGTTEYWLFGKQKIPGVDFSQEDGLLVWYLENGSTLSVDKQGLHTNRSKHDQIHSTNGYPAVYDTKDRCEFYVRGKKVSEQLPDENGVLRFHPPGSRQLSYEDMLDEPLATEKVLFPMSIQSVRDFFKKPKNTNQPG